MSLKNKILQGTFFLSASNIAVRVFSFFTVIIVTRVFSVAEYGIFTLFMSLVGPVALFSSMGLDDIIISDTSRAMGEGDGPRAKGIIKQFFGLRFALIIALLTLIFIFKDRLVLKYGPEFINYFWLFVSLVMVQYIRGIFSILLSIYERFRAISAINVIEIAFRFLLLAAFYFSKELSMTHLILCYILGPLFAIVIFGPYIYKILSNLKDTKATSENILYKTLRGHGKWQIVSEVTGGPMNTVRYWLLKLFISTEAVGLLALAQNLFSALSSFLPLKNVIFPVIAKKSQDKAFFNIMLQKTTKYSFLFYALMVIGAEIAMVPLIPYVFPKYILAVPLFQLLAFRLLLNPTSVTQGSALTIFRRQKFTFYCGFVPWVSTLTLLPLSLIKFGVFGAVMESLISVILVTVVREVYLRKYLEIRTVGFSSFFSIDESDKVFVKEIYLKIKSKLMRTADNGAPPSGAAGR